MTDRGICMGCEQLIQDHEDAVKYKQYLNHATYWHVQCRRTHNVVTKILKQRDDEQIRVKI